MRYKRKRVKIGLRFGSNCNNEVKLYYFRDRDFLSKPGRSPSAFMLLGFPMPLRIQIPLPSARVRPEGKVRFSPEGGVELLNCITTESMIVPLCTDNGAMRPLLDCLSASTRRVAASLVRWSSF